LIASLDDDFVIALRTTQLHSYTATQPSSSNARVRRKSSAAVSIPVPSKTSLSHVDRISEERSADSMLLYVSTPLAQPLALSMIVQGAMRPTF
jgi:hypothetical protein